MVHLITNNGIITTTRLSYTRSTSTVSVQVCPSPFQIAKSRPRPPCAVRPALAQRPTDFRNSYVPDPSHPYLYATSCFVFAQRPSSHYYQSHDHRPRSESRSRACCAPCDGALQRFHLLEDPAKEAGASDQFRRRPRKGSSRTPNHPPSCLGNRPLRPHPQPRPLPSRELYLGLCLGGLVRCSVTCQMWRCGRRSHWHNHRRLRHRH